MVSFSVVMVAGFLAGSGPVDSAPPDRNRSIVRRPGHELLTATDRHVRATCSRAQELVAQGLKRSYTFASLMHDLEATDLIVHIELTSKLPSNILGRLLFATALVNGPRYLRIQIAPDGSTGEQIAALAHELRHALEVANAADVRDLESFGRLYKRIGVPASEARFDTVAAQVTGQRVLLEVGR